MFDFMTVARALADENRVRILMALREREMCVCQVTGFLDLSPSATSKHLSILKQARLIESRKKGKWVHYRLADSEHTSATVRGALAWVVSGVGDSPVMREDARRIARILECEEETCAAMGADADMFHSIEIHTFSDQEMTAVSEEEI